MNIRAMIDKTGTHVGARAVVEASIVQFQRLVCLGVVRLMVK